MRYDYPRIPLEQCVLQVLGLLCVYYHFNIIISSKTCCNWDYVHVQTQVLWCRLPSETKWGERGDASRVRTIKGLRWKCIVSHSFSMTLPAFFTVAVFAATEIQNCCRSWDRSGRWLLSLGHLTPTQMQQATQPCITQCVLFCSLGRTPTSAKPCWVWTLCRNF